MKIDFFRILKFHVKPFIFCVFFLPITNFAQHFSTTTIELQPFPDLPRKDENIVRHISSNEIFNVLTPEQKDWYYYTNLSRLKPIFFYDSIVEPILKVYPSLVSSYTRSLKKDLYSIGSLPIIIPNTKLLKIAQSHANDLATRESSPSHNSSNGNTFQQRMIKNEVNRCAAENISFGPSNTIMALVLLYIDEGLPDVGHRKNLLEKNHFEMGVGISSYSNNNVLVVQDFSCSQTP